MPAVEFVVRMVLRAGVRHLRGDTDHDIIHVLYAIDCHRPEVQAGRNAYVSVYSLVVYIIVFLRNEIITAQFHIWSFSVQVPRKASLADKHQSRRVRYLTLRQRHILIELPQFSHRKNQTIVIILQHCFFVQLK